ncbi:hypothetical protein [Deinococcus cellulosilyticus]|nr:hypothetical protein [Deinococcus cellulosilyticus]
MSKTSQRFAKVTQPNGTELTVPQAKDVGTFIYVGDGVQYPKFPTVTLLLDGHHLTEGTIFELEEMRPGHGMGETISVQVAYVRLQVSLFPGKYGQLKRHIYCDPVIPNDEKSDAFAETFGLGDSQ